MKSLIQLSLIIVLSTTALPAFAQSSGTNGSGSVAGEGPGGSGAGQPAAGPSKSPPGAPATDNTMMMKKAEPAGQAKAPAAAPAVQ